MLTIGQLARHTGVPAKTVRFYHSQAWWPNRNVMPPGTVGTAMLTR